MVQSVSPSSTSVDVLTIQGTDDLTYEKVNEIIGTATDVYFDGYVSIGEGAFKGSSIRTIRIGKSVIGIKDQAFKGVNSLTNIIFDDGSNLKTIGYQSFYNTSLVDVTLPVSTNVIFDEAFARCNNLLSVTLTGDNLTYIGHNAFAESSINSLTANKNQLATLILSVGINTLGGKQNVNVRTFDSPAIESMLTSKLINSLSPRTISGEGELTAAARHGHGIGNGTGDLTIIGYSIIGANAFEYNEMSGVITFPASLTTIRSRAFYRMKYTFFVNFENVNLLTYIGYEAFRNSNGLTSITIPASVEFIGHLAFADCKGLTTVKFDNGSSLNQIGHNGYDKDNLFYGSSPLSSFSGPQSVLDLFGVEVGTGKTVGGKQGVTVKFADTTIAGSGVLTQAIVYSAINDGSYVDGVIISGFSSIADDAFELSKNISGIIRIPASVTVIGENSFDACTKLTSVIFESGSQLVTIGRNAFASCSLLNSVNFNDLNQLKTIGDDAFSLTSIGRSITSSLTLPSSLESIGSGAFNTCNGLTSVNFYDLNQLTTIGDNAFRLTSLSGSFTMPASLTSIGNYAFAYCYYMSTVTFEYDSQIATLGNDSFKSSGLATFTAPITLLDSIGITAGWRRTVGGKDRVEVFEAVRPRITISGSGVLTKAKVQAAIQDGSTALDVIVTGFTSIGSYAFQVSLLSGSITLPASLTSIGEGAFDGCTSLTSVVFESGSQLETIYYGAFQSSGLTSLTLPASLITIWSHVFNNSSSLSSVIFESGSNLVTIGDNAFKGTGLSGQMTLPASVTSIGNEAFYQLTASSFSFESGSQLETIAQGAFYETGLSGSLSLPASLTSIGQQAFYGCSSLTSVSFPLGSQLTNIEDDTAMFEYSGLTTFTAPQSVLTLFNVEVGTGKTVGGKGGVTVIEAVPPRITISGSYQLTQDIVEGVIQDGSNAVDVIITGYTSIDQYAFQDSRGISGSITLPASLTTIGYGAFKYCSSLTSVIFESGSQLTTIGVYAFAYTGLSESITLPASVTSIGNGAFLSCSSLTSVIFESGSQLTTIGSYAFESSGLSGSISLPASLTSIGRRAFYKCSSLTSVSFPIASQLTTIGDYYTELFIDSGLTTFTAPQSVLTLFNVEVGTGKTVGGKGGVTVIEAVPPRITISGEGVLTKAKVEEAIQDGSNAVDVIVTGFTSIDTYAFQDSKLRGSITLPASLTSTGYGSFVSCSSLTSVIFESGSQLETIGYGSFQLTGLTSITLPASLITLSEYAFYNSSSLTTVSFDSGSNLDTIGDLAFKGTGLSGHITLPASVTSIGSSAFEFCYSLTSVTLPASLTSIGDTAFLGCYSLTSVSFPIGSLLTTVSVNGPGVFAGTALSSLSGPKTVLDAFGVQPGSDRTVGGKENVTVTLLQTIIAGQGVLTQEKVLAAIQDGSAAVDVIITGFDSIAVDAFKLSKNISGSITIPNSVTSIGNSAFYECASLTSVIFESGSNLSTIGSDAFYKSGLTSIATPSTVTSIGERAFYQCLSMSSVSFESGSNLKTIGNSAFYNSGLSGSIAIPASVESIGSTSFFYCTGLDSISFDTGSQVVSIGYGAFTFSGLSGSIAFPASLTTIHASFTNCPSLTTVTFPLGSQLNSVGAGEFEVTGLTSFTGPKTVLDAFGVQPGTDRTVGGKENVTVTLLQTIIDGQGVLTKVKVIAAIQDGSTAVDFIITGFTSIADNAFEESKNISGSVTLPASLTSIGNGAFSDLLQLDVCLSSRVTVN